MVSSKLYFLLLPKIIFFLSGSEYVLLNETELIEGLAVLKDYVDVVED